MKFVARHFFDLDAIGAGLVVAAARPELERAAHVGAMVVTAPPGTGKTTFVPPLVAHLVAERAARQGADAPPPRVLLTQPRRVAVRAAARRIAHLDRSDLGGAVGFTVRGERTVGRDTQLEVLTPGVLLRRLISDPSLENVGAVILDEIHERSVDGDLLLGLVSEVRALRDDLIVVSMSATLDAGHVAEVLGAAAGTGPAQIVEIPSALFPLDIEHAPFDGPRLDERGVTRGFLAHLAEVALSTQRAAGTDALVFVPGAREVDEVVRLLRAGASGSQAVEILPLHGRIPAREQDRAVQGRAHPAEPARIVVSTSLAESALTVPGVRLVVDSGLSREVRRDRARDMTGLVTVSSSRASAEQRAGRAARQGPGRAVRAYSETDFARMPAASNPEISSADLTDAALLLAAWGAPGGRGIVLPTPPPPASMARAETVLHTLELVDDTGHVTALGNRVVRMPVGVREARALLAGARELGDPALAAEVVAAFSDDHRDAGADLHALLRELRTGRTPGADRWRRERRRLEGIASEASVGPSPERTDTSAIGSAPPSSGAIAGIVTALARPEWIARRVSEHSRTYLLASGTRAALPEGSGLLGSEWLAVREVQRSDARTADGTGAVIRLAASLAEADAFRLAGPLLTQARHASIQAGRVRVREERRLGAILLSSTPTAARAEDAGPAFAAELRATGLSALRWSEAATALRARLALVHRALGAPWPAMTDESLIHHLDDWLGPALSGLRAGESLHAISVAAALRGLLPWPEAARLDALAPERLALPSGSTAQIQYPDAEDSAAPPVVAVKLQELFGLAESPTLVDGRVSILFHLLSPARKPLAVTSDLVSFWNGPYQDVRKEMRGRYPKHPWPEDPWTAQATALTKRRLGQ